MDTDKNTTQFVSVAVWAAIAFSIPFGGLLCLGRWWFHLGGELIQLTLLLGSLIVASLLIIPGSWPDLRRQKLIDILRYLLATATVLAICAWAPGVAIAIILSLPVLTALCLPVLVRRTGMRIEFSRGADHPCSNSPDKSGSPNFQVNQALATESDVGSFADCELAVESDSQVEGASASDPRLAEEAIDLLSSELPIEPELDSAVPCPFDNARRIFLEDPSVSGYTTRWMAEDGGETMLTVVRCQFETGQQSATIQAPIWPFFAQTPEVYCEIVDGPDATIKTTECKKHGLRIDLRIAKKPPQPLELVLEIVAIAPAAQPQVESSQAIAVEVAKSGDRADAAA